MSADQTGMDGQNQTPPSPTAAHAGGPDGLPRWLNRLSRAVMWLLLLAGLWAALWLTQATRASLDLDPVAVGLIAFCVGMVFWFFAIAVHEAGHALAAHWAGMRLLSMQIGMLAVQFRRRGLRLRLAAPPVGLHGFVNAAADPAQPLRPAMVRLVIGGPLANGLMAVLCAALAMGLPSLWRELLLAMAVVNAVLGLCNLLPMALPHPSDGMQLYLWWRHRQEDSPHLALIRLIACLSFGTPPDQLPAQYVQQLHQRGGLEALLASWIDLNACQYRGDWPGCQAVQAQIEHRLDALPKADAQRGQLAIALIRLDMAICQTLHTQDPTHLPPYRIDSALHGNAPYLRPRLAALHAALQGQSAQMEQALQQACAQASDMPDHSLALSEARMAEHIRALCAGRAGLQQAESQG